ncbi:MAG: Holliday junction branch migration protein RuvA [Clostridia bacterium]|nr:Holliday junction branch migration protein RuvA [Clostridia bacterium]
MFYYIEGTVAIVEDGVVVLDCGGVGYKLGVSRTSMSRAKIGQKLRLYTVVHIREDAFDLYGFPEKEEKKFFLMLTDISGVGPKAALSILSCASPDKLALAIMTGDEKLITSAQGVGKKLAQRIILELRDKVAKETESDPAEFAVAESVVTDSKGARSSAVSALMVLGYSRQEAVAAVATVGEDVTATEEIIRIALKNT